MTILQTINGVWKKTGGPATCTYNLMDAIDSICNKTVTLLCAEAPQNDTLCGPAKGWMHLVANDFKFGALAYSRNMCDFIQKTLFDIYHTHGNWSHYNHYTAKYARSKHRPYIISPHGNFYPQALSVSRQKKALIRTLWVNRDMREAAVICATSQQEMEYIRICGFFNPIAIIPNPITIPSYIQEIHHHHTDKQIFGYLGRLHPIKNIDRIINAWAILGNKVKNAELHIYGCGEYEYEKFLQNEASRLGLQNVYFKGGIYGREKYEALANMTVLLSPSEQENFGMSIAEGLLTGTPVVASKNTPWETLYTHQCGWWIDNDIQTIANIIEEILSLPETTLKEMGNRGRQLIIQRYSAPIIAHQMLTLYNWVNTPNYTERPGFVYL